jgi:hypothetical protein
MPLRDHWWCILVAKYGAFLFTEIGAVVITDYTKQSFANTSQFGYKGKSLFRLYGSCASYERNDKRTLEIIHIWQ